jgi:hypothetical protein
MDNSQLPMSIFFCEVNHAAPARDLFSALSPTLAGVALGNDVGVGRLPVGFFGKGHARPFRQVHLTHQNG